MGGEFAGRRILRASLALFLISPYLAWLARGPLPAAPPPGAWLILPRALGQALASTAVALTLGFWLGRGAKIERARAYREASLLLPGTLPPLFLAFALIGIFPAAVTFPFGMTAVIAAHGLVHGGLVAIAWSRIERSSLAGAADAAWTLGIPPRAFWRSVAWPLVAGEVIDLAAFVFTSCFVSFSLPVLLQGGATATLEVYIYDLLRETGRWDQALTLAFVQTAGLLTIARLRIAPISPRASFDSRAYPPRPIWWWLGWAPGAMVIAGLGGALARASGFGAVEARQLITSAALGGAVGGVILTLGLATAYASPHRRFASFLRGFAPPGAVITGFGFLLVAPGGGFGWLVAALSLLSFPPLYRWRVHAPLAALEPEWITARTLGAAPAQILAEITWPRVAPALFGASALGAVWAAGDFALSGLLLEPGATLPLAMVERMAHYEWNQAFAMLTWLLAISSGLYIVFAGLGRSSRAD